MNKAKFIKTSDPDTVNQLLKLGYTIISQDSKITTFLNQDNKHFTDTKKVVYTDKLHI